MGTKRVSAAMKEGNIPHCRQLSDEDDSSRDNEDLKGALMEGLLLSFIARTDVIIASTSLTVIWLASVWPHWEWFLDLLSLTVNKPLQVPVIWNILVLPYVRKFHQGLNIIRICACKLCRDLCEMHTFWDRLWWKLQHRLCTREVVYLLPLVLWENYYFKQGYCSADSRFFMYLRQRNCWC